MFGPSRMSALGQKRTCARQKPMSAKGQKQTLGALGFKMKRSPPLRRARLPSDYAIRILCSGSGPRELGPRRHAAERRRNGRRHNPQSIRSPLAQAGPLKRHRLRARQLISGDFTSCHGALLFYRRERYRTLSHRRLGRAAAGDVLEISTEPRGVGVKRHREGNYSSAPTEPRSITSMRSHVLHWK